MKRMEAEHDDAGAALERLSTLTDSYTPPAWACNSYRALVDGLRDFERDMHTHVHKENNILFMKVRATLDHSEGVAR
jgi:regulator of cell morphogenesis and NO signaling